MSVYKNPYTGASPFTRSGRPITPDSTRMVAISATLQIAQREWLKTLGHGSISDGLRAAIGLAGGPKTVTSYQRAVAEREAKLAKLDAAGSAMNPPAAVETPEAPAPETDAWDE